MYAQQINDQDKFIEEARKSGQPVRVSERAIALPVREQGEIVVRPALTRHYTVEVKDELQATCGSSSPSTSSCVTKLSRSTRLSTRNSRKTNFASSRSVVFPERHEQQSSYSQASHALRGGRALLGVSIASSVSRHRGECSTLERVAWARQGAGHATSSAAASDVEIVPRAGPIARLTPVCPGVLGCS